MRLRGEILGFATGMLAAAAFAAATTHASEPPPRAGQHGHSAPQPHGAQSGRWHAPESHDGPHAGPAHGEAHAAGPAIAFRGCAYFDGANFAGRRGEIREGVSVEWLGRGWSDRISSAACHPGCRMIGYVDINYGGARRNFTGAVADLGTGWNDRISALRAVCDGTAPDQSH